MPVPSKDDCPINSFSSQKDRVMCGHPYVYMALVLANVECTEYADASNETSVTMVDRHYNAGNALLEALTMPGSSPKVQRSLQGWVVCRVAVSCPIAVDILYMSMSMEW